MTRFKRTLPTCVALLYAASANASDTHLNKMRGYTEMLRNLAFQGVIASSGSECSGVTHSFIRGADPDGMVFIAARCRGGDDYMIMEDGKKKGSTILTCDQAAEIFARMGVFDNCWMPLEIRRD